MDLYSFPNSQGYIAMIVCIFKKITAVLLLLVLILTAGCVNDETETSPQDGAAVYQKITAEQAREMMGGDETFFLLDVRTDDEYLERRIDGSVLIPHLEIRERAPDALPDKEAIILIYCRSGARSAAAANELIEMGYTNVYDFGGIVDWTHETTSGVQ